MLSSSLYLTTIFAVCLAFPPAKIVPASGVDVYGDPLPAGAIARLGTIRWRVDDGAWGMDFSPDGTKLAVGMRGGASIFDVVSGRRTTSLQTGDRSILAVSYSPTGDALAAVAENSVSICDPKTGKLLRQLISDGDDDFGSVAFAPKGRLLASCGQGVYNGKLRLWDPDSGKQLRAIAHPNGVVRFAFDGTGQEIATVCWDRVVRVFDATTGQEKAQFKGDDRGIGDWSIAYSPNSKYLAAAIDGTTFLWDLETKQQVGLGDEFRKSVPLAFTPDGRFLAVRIQDRGQFWVTIAVIDIRDGTEAKRFGPVSRCSFASSRDGKTVAAGAGSSIRLWDFKSGKELLPLEAHRADVWQLAWSPDGANIVTGAGDDTVRLWDVSAGTHVRKLADDWQPGCMGFIDRRRLLRTANLDFSVRICDAATGKELDKLVLPMTYVRAISESGGVVATNTVEGVVSIRDAATLKVQEKAPGKYHRVLSASADCSMLAIDSRNECDRTLRFWSAKTKDFVHVVNLNDDEIDAGHVALSRNGALAAISVDRRKIVLRDLDQQKELRRIAAAGEDEEVVRLTFSPSGSLLAMAHSNNSIRIYDVSSGQKLFEFHGHRGRANVLAFSPSGQILASASDDSVLLWSWDQRR